MSKALISDRAPSCGQPFCAANQVRQLWNSLAHAVISSAMYDKLALDRLESFLYKPNDEPTNLWLQETADRLMPVDCVEHMSAANNVWTRTLPCRPRFW